MIATLFLLIACVVIGSIVAALDRRSSDGWELTAIATAGAIAGSVVGRVLGLSAAFGEIAGLVCSCAGAVLLLRLYRSEADSLRMGDIPETHGAGHAVPLPQPTWPTIPPYSPPPARSMLRLVGGAFAWGTLCAFTAAVAGVAGHYIGAQFYPQRYEQIPSDFFFVPLGMLVGFTAAGLARLAGREWNGFAMVSFVALVTIAYGGVMYQYSRGRAIPLRIVTTIQPDPVVAAACMPGTCAPTDPPSQWYVVGRLSLTETSGLGATVDRIEISSETPSEGPPVAHRYTKEDAAQAARWRGPLVVLTGGDIPGPRRIPPNAEATYRIVYAYHTRESRSRRAISVSVYLTDRAGRPGYTYTNLRVW